jgi:hypothetical protein
LESGGDGDIRPAVMVGGLELGRRDLAAGRVEALVVPPGHPRRGRELDLVGRPSRPLGSDGLGLVQPVDGLGESVVIAVALNRTDFGGDFGLRADRGDGPLVGEGAPRN